MKKYTISEVRAYHARSFWEVEDCYLNHLDKIQWGLDLLDKVERRDDDWSKLDPVKSIGGGVKVLEKRLEETGGFLTLVERGDKTERPFFLEIGEDVTTTDELFQVIDKKKKELEEQEEACKKAIYDLPKFYEKAMEKLAEITRMEQELIPVDGIKFGSCFLGK